MNNIKWQSSNGTQFDINEMATPYIENCLSYIDKHIAKAYKQGARYAYFVEAKKEMLNELNKRYQKEVEAKLPKVEVKQYQTNNNDIVIEIRIKNK
jgi:methyl coenzyme M reductase alpha subunit